MTSSSYPDFLVIGPQKCGTTTLYGLIRQHPDVFLPPQKELHYFACGGQQPSFTDSASTALNSTAVWKESDYTALYAASDAAVKGEICPTYLYADGAAQRIAQVRPDAKIIAILRDPIERSFSAYRHMKARGAELSERFEDALAKESDYIAQNWQAMSHYTATSLYYPQLKAYYDHFPAEQILVLDFTDLTAAPIATANKVLAFVGANPLPDAVGVAQTNKTVVLKSGLLGKILITQPFWLRKLRGMLPATLRAKAKEWLVAKLPSEDEKLTPELRAKLAPVFAQDAEKTRTLTGQEFKNWSV